MKVAFITPDWAIDRTTDRAIHIGGSGYYRCALIADALNRHALDVTAKVFRGARQRIAHGRVGELVPLNHDKTPDETGWDVIVLQRWMSAEDRDRTLAARAAGQIVINDVDDHFWALHKANSAYASTSRPDWNGELYKRNLAASDHITVSTSHLAHVLADLDVPITVLPNAIDLEQWTCQPVRDHVEAIGWCGHLSYRSGDLETVGNAIRYYLRDHQDVKFIHGGYDPTARHIADVLNIPRSRIGTRPACPIDRWPRIWHGLDLAIIPVNPIDFNKAKSPIKAMEASAAGVPFVATDFGPYKDYGCGLLASTPTQWRDQLEIAGSPNARQRLVTTAYDRVSREDILSLIHI